MKTAFVFPGQGAQYIGMAMDYVTEDPKLEQVLTDFDAKHGVQLRKIMAEGPEDKLKDTSITQPAILFHSICAWRKFTEVCSLVPDFVAGHSLGEFSALVANGMLSLSDAMHIVHKRGEYMIKANAGVPFAMSAIIGLDAQDVIHACNEATGAGLVRAVNFNTPSQTVISGTEDGVRVAGDLAKAKGAKRVIPLVVGGPFHTPLINEASIWLEAEMKSFTFNPSDIPVVSNLDALPSNDPDECRDRLVKQIISPVQWVQCIQYMINAGVQRFIEFGPQKVLGGMIKNIDKEMQVLNIDKLEDVQLIASQI